MPYRDAPEPLKLKASMLESELAALTRRRDELVQELAETRVELRNADRVRAPESDPGGWSPDAAARVVGMLAVAFALGGSSLLASLCARPPCTYVLPSQARELREARAPFREPSRAIAFDVRAALRDRTVVTTTGLPRVTPMDGSAYDLYTASFARRHGAFGGLPDDGRFAAREPTHPAVRLAFHEGDDAAPDSRVLTGDGEREEETDLSFEVPARLYQRVQLYGTSTEGASRVTVTFRYDDGDTSSSDVTIPDWVRASSNDPNVFVLASHLGRTGSGVFDAGRSFAIYGANAYPDPERRLVEVTLHHEGNSRYVFYGASGR